MPQDQNDRGAETTAPCTSDTIAGPPSTLFWDRWWPASAAAGLVVAAAAALAVDCRLSRWCLTGGCPEELRHLLETCEPFGDGLGVLVIAVVIHQLDPTRRWALPRLLASAWGAGLAANLVKMLVVRWRPRVFDFRGTVWATFGGWLPGTSAGYDGQSLPSAHTATAAGLALALAWLYPNGRRLYPVLVVLVAAHRVEAGAHYLSDVLCGAALGLVVAGGCVKDPLLRRLFDRLEARWRPPP